MPGWTFGLCSCFEDISLCFVTYVAPCLTAGKNAEAMGENCLLYGCLSVTCLGLYFNPSVRTKIRAKYGIEGSFINDMLVHCFCPICAMVQDAQEIKAHGGGGGMAMARE